MLKVEGTFKSLYCEVEIGVRLDGRSLTTVKFYDSDAKFIVGNWT